MKKTALFLALTAPALAQAEKVEIDMPDFYGKANVSVQNATEGGNSFSEVKSNASRIGFKGKGELGHGLTAIYQVEYQYNADGDNDETFEGETETGLEVEVEGSETFSQRNTYAGLDSDYGQVIIGRFDTPLKKLQKKVDLFNDLEGDIKTVITSSDNREENSVQYTSPKFAGLQLKVDQIASEDRSSDRKDAVSTSLTYTRGDYYFGVAYDDKVEGNDTDVLRAVTQVNIAGAQLGALWEQQDEDGEKTEGWLLSASYKLGAVKLKAQHGESEIRDEDGARTTSVGADYKLGKGAKAFVYYTANNYKDSDNTDYAGVGIEYKF
ncbi:porin [Bacterioplanoides sp. SCSIO 12839]|uniref:porin n=1 Tax=Bacterioplanoides sp. SCSIO 12839 TaxID=2829569 RepID=UPI002104C7DE|nr:porin [Bacterioplanoides sp. SCSIO 12839]UTW48607.1 porin [Bacterioplanoides sp. SCSIO 12839]